jgi:DNA-binding NarL/FixJ family response regulator
VNAPGATLGIVLADAPRMVRAGMANLFGSTSDMEVVVEAGEADTCLQATRRLPRRTDAVAVIGLGLPGQRDSFWLIRSIRERFPTLPILACAAGADEPAISRAFFVGADGFADKDVEPEDFLDAIRRTALGEVVLEGVPASWVPRIANHIEQQGLAPSRLTDRELEVLSVAMEGLTARQIARQLGLRERTVTTHFTRIYRKLGVTGRLAAISKASRSGFLTTAGPVGDTISAPPNGVRASTYRF